MVILIPHFGSLRRYLRVFLVVIPIVGLAGCYPYYDGHVAGYYKQGHHGSKHHRGSDGHYYHRDRGKRHYRHGRDRRHRYRHYYRY